MSENMEGEKLISKGGKALILLFAPPLLVIITLYLYDIIFASWETAINPIACILFLYMAFLPITLLLHALTSFYIYGVLQWMERMYQEDAVKNKRKIIAAPIIFSLATILLELSIWFLITKYDIYL